MSVDTAGAEVERVMTACIFAIATGRWSPEDPVPSVRSGAERWGVAPATVHQAYQRLAERGVLRSESRRGYFVRTGRPVEHLVRHSDALAQLYAAVRAQVEARADLSPLGTFRHMLRQAERDASLRPECAFVECTLAQARRHALEIEARLGLTCQVVDVHTMDPEGWVAPPGLRVLVTTAFHAGEIAPLAERLRLRTLVVPLVCSPDETRRLCRGATRLEIRSVNPAQGHLVADDIRGILGDSTPHISVREASPAGLEAELVLALGTPDDPKPGVKTILSMYLWEALPDAWRVSGAVHPYPYCIDPGAWTDMATSLGVPLAV